MSGTTGRPVPPTLRSLDRLGYELEGYGDDEHDGERPPETPAYRRNMSQLTLPPEYLSDGGETSGSIPPVPTLRDEKRRESSDDDVLPSNSRSPGGDGGHGENETAAGAHPGPPTLTLQTSDAIIPIGRRGLGSAGATPLSTTNGTPLRTGTTNTSHDLSLNEKGSPASRGMYEGETLVNPRQKHTHYAAADSDVDEHGGMPRAHFMGGTATRRSSMDSSRAPSVADTDNEEEPDEFYDWSDEEDLVDQEAHFETKLNQRTNKKKGWGPRRIATFFLSTLIGTTILTSILVAVPITLRFVYLLPHRTQHRESVTVNVSAWFYWAAANLLISWFLAVIVNVIPHVITWFVSVIWGTITESFKTKIGLFEALKGWFKPILYAASAWVSWVIIFANIYGLHNTAKEVVSNAAYTDRMYQIIEFLFFLVLLVCIEKIMLQLVAFTFHRAAYQDRLNEVNSALQAFDHLKDYRPKRRNGASTPRAFKSGRMTPPMGFGRINLPGTPSIFGLGSRPGTPEPGLVEEGYAHQHTHDADTEDAGGEYFGRTSHRKKASRSAAAKSRSRSPSDDEKQQRPTHASRRSWLPFGHGHHEKGQDSEGGEHYGTGAEMMPMSPNTRIPGDATNEAGPSRTTSQDFEKAVKQNARKGRHNYSRSGSNTPEFGNGHTYPPGAERSSEDPESADAGVQTFAQAARVLKTAVMHDARNIKGKDTTDNDVAFTITSPHEAKKLARNLYFAFRQDRKRTYLIPSDFYPAYPTPEAAKEAFKIFDKDNNENITRAEIKTTVMKVYKERRFLARSLKDVGQALTTLDWIMLAFASIVLFFVALSVFDVDIDKLLTSVYTLGLALSFIFKNAASNGFDAIMFLFVSHPYDTGDRCFIDGENLVVKKMGLFATTFTRADGTSTYYFNVQLTTKFILNARRSSKTAEACTLQIDWRTPLSKIDALEKALNHWIDTDENRWYSGATSIMLQHIDYQRSLEITIGIPHNQNWQDWGAALTRRTAFHAAVNHYCREIGITYANSPQPILITTPATHQPPAAEELLEADEGQELFSPDTANTPHHQTSMPTPLPPAQPTLFFLPPKDDRAAGLRKRRKADVGGANI